MIALALLVMPILTSADTLTVNLGSIHSSQGEVINGQKLNFNQFNPGIGQEFSDLAGFKNIEIGYYNNSDFKDSFYALKNEKLSKHFGYSFGLATGYQSAITPLVTLNVITGPLVTRLAVVPKHKFELGDGFQVVAGFSLRF
jgi:hypothetical protein